MTDIRRIKTLAQNNLSLTLLIFCFLGLYFPPFEQLPSWVIIACLASGIFIACFGIRAEELSELRISRILFFYVCRFVLLPPLLYYSVVPFAPTYALGLFLLAALPPGVSSPAMNRIFGGNVSLSFALTLVGNLLVPLLLPLMLYLVVGQKAEIDIRQLFYMLLFSILGPIVLFLLLRRREGVQSFIHKEGAFLTSIFIGMTIAIAVAKRRTQILDNPIALLPAFLTTLAAFGLFYAFGWYFHPKAPFRNKTAYSLGSGAINISLGVSIALLYFPPEISLFLVVGEIPWILVLMPFKSFTRRQLTLSHA